MYFYDFLAVFYVFMHVFKKCFYENVKNTVFYVFLNLQINVFNIYIYVLH